MTTNTYADFVARAKLAHGDDLDLSDVEACAQFLPYFQTGQRIRVRTGDWERTGRVSVTTGWKPALLLVHRSSDTGSWDVLGPDDVVTAVQRNGRYVEV